MEIQKEEGFFRKIGEKLKVFREELRKDSVGSNPRKPVDCCNPPEAISTEHKPKK